MSAFSSPAVATNYLVQFVRFRRGAREITRTLTLPADDPVAALNRAKALLARGSWPARTEALRVLDDGGRTLIDWEVPGSTLTSTPSPRTTNPEKGAIPFRRQLPADAATNRWENEGGASSPQQP